MSTTIKISNILVILRVTVRVARTLEIFSRTICRFVVIEILLHAYFEYF